MTIKRINTNKRMSQATIYGKTIYLAGQVAVDTPNTSIATQTNNILDRIDNLLAEAGSNKSRLLSATIWLTSMDNFDEMNSVWDNWIPSENAPARACVESKLAAPQFTVEIAVIAVVD